MLLCRVTSRILNTEASDGQHWSGRQLTMRSLSMFLICGRYSRPSIGALRKISGSFAFIIERSGADAKKTTRKKLTSPSWRRFAAKVMTPPKG
jgi:hypothetical protein